MNGPREHAQVLLEKAAHDLIAAKATIATGRALDTVCFHAQQAAEKSLKALLALKDIAYPWRHDIGELVALAQSHFPSVAPLQDALIELSPYAVTVRYDAMSPDMPEARSALATVCNMHTLAEQIVTSAEAETQQ